MSAGEVHGKSGASGRVTERFPVWVVVAAMLPVVIIAIVKESWMVDANDPQVAWYATQHLASRYAIAEPAALAQMIPELEACGAGSKASVESSCVERLALVIPEDQGGPTAEQVRYVERIYSTMVAFRRSNETRVWKDR